MMLSACVRVGKTCPLNHACTIISSFAHTMTPAIWAPNKRGRVSSMVLVPIIYASQKWKHSKPATCILKHLVCTHCISCQLQIVSHDSPCRFSVVVRRGSDFYTRAMASAFSIGVQGNAALKRTPTSVSTSVSDQNLLPVLSSDILDRVSDLLAPRSSV